MWCWQRWIYICCKKTKIPKNLLTNMKRIKIDNDGVVLLFQEK